MYECKVRILISSWMNRTRFAGIFRADSSQWIKYGYHNVLMSVYDSQLALYFFFRSMRIKVILIKFRVKFVYSHLYHFMLSFSLHLFLSLCALHTLDSIRKRKNRWQTVENLIVKYLSFRFVASYMTHNHAEWFVYQ